MIKEDIIEFSKSIGIDTIGFINAESLQNLESFILNGKLKIFKMNLKKMILKKE